MVEPFPNKDKLQIKPKFEERYRQLLGDRYDSFMEYSLSFMRRGVRVNTLKTSADELIKRMKDWKFTPVPWYSDAFWIDHKGVGDAYRRDVGNTTEHALGYFYIQEPASTIPPLVLDPQEGDIVLDMCAAPGSKTTQIAQLMNNNGLVVANEYTGSRIAALGINLQRIGVSCAVISHNDGNRINKELRFDKILVDAPCSGTGTIRKSPKTLLMWNPGLIKRLGKTQLSLLKNAYKLLKPGGTLVYSTCTLEPEEDEGVVHEFLQLHSDMDVTDIELNIVRSEPVTEFDGKIYDTRVKKAIRIYPQDNDSEGFFICKMIKKLE